MTTAFFNSRDTAVVSAGDLTELVRGPEHAFVARLTPLVRQRSVALDMAHIERIDAAGIAALITLYGTARDAGHDFSVLNPAPHVAEILALVGLSRILVSTTAACPPLSGNCMECPAA